MTRLVAVKPVWYHGKEHQPGDTFDVDEKDTVHIWTAEDLPGGPTAKYADKQEQKKPVPVQTAAVRAEPAPVKEAVPEPDKQRKFYRRRDVRAED